MRLLQYSFDRTWIVQRYRQLILLMADGLENMDSAVVSNSRSDPVVNLQKEIEEVRHEVDDLKEELLNSDTIEEFIALKNILRNAAAITGKIRMLNHYTHPHSKEVRSSMGQEMELNRFTTHKR